MKYDFWIEPTTQCNLKCKMCTLGHENSVMSEKLQNIVAQYAHKACKNMHLYLRGEPLLAGLKWFSNFFKLNNDGDVYYKVITNGMLLDQSFAHLFSQYNVDLIFSIDSADPSTFSRIRRGASLDTIEFSLKLAHEMGIKTSIYCTVQKYNVESFKDILNFAISHNVHSVGLGFVVEPRSCSFTWTPQIVQSFLEFPSQLQGAGLSSCGLPQFIPGHKLTNGKYYRFDEPTQLSCDQCRRTLCVTSSGEVSVCFKLPRIIGNLEK